MAAVRHTTPLYSCSYATPAYHACSSNMNNLPACLPVCSTCVSVSVCLCVSSSTVFAWSDRLLSVRVRC
jgi:hypothetical protein